MIKWNDKKVMSKVGAKYHQALTDACLIVVKSTKENFRDSGITGATKEQRRSAAAAAHKASSGGIPFIQTGILHDSIGYEIVKERDELEGHVGPMLGFKDDESGEEAASYGKILEIGGPKRKAYPYLRPALEREHSQIMRQFKDWL